MIDFKVPDLLFHNCKASRSGDPRILCRKILWDGFQSSKVVKESVGIRPYSKIKRLHKKEMSSSLVGLSFHDLDALSLPLLEVMGTTADKNWKQIKLLTFFSPFLWLQAFAAQGRRQLFLM